MKLLIIRTLSAYIVTVIWMLISLFCNPYLKMGRQNIETGEFEASSGWFKILFSIFWFITIPIYFRGRRNDL